MRDAGWATLAAETAGWPCRWRSTVPASQPATRLRSCQRTCPLCGMALRTHCHYHCVDIPYTSCPLRGGRNLCAKLEQKTTRCEWSRRFSSLSVCLSVCVSFPVVSVHPCISPTMHTQHASSFFAFSETRRPGRREGGTRTGFRGAAGLRYTHAQAAHDTHTPELNLGGGGVALVRGE